MLALLAQNWGLIVTRGILALVFGIIALIWPGITLGVLVIIFGIYVLLEGIIAMVTAISNRSVKYWWLLLLEGLAGVVIGLFAFIWPSLTAVVLLIFIAAWAIITGIIEIAVAIQLRKETQGEIILAIAGIFSILIGLLLISNPGTGALALVWLIGLYAVLFGALLVFLGIKLRKFRQL